MDDDTLEKFLREIDEQNQLKRKRKGHTYVEDLISILLPAKNQGLARSIVLDQLKRQRRQRGLPVPATFEQAVQSVYNQHCVNSDVFRKRNLPNSAAPFFSPGGSGSGIWAADPERAQEWGPGVETATLVRRRCLNQPAGESISMGSLRCSSPSVEHSAPHWS